MERAVAKADKTMPSSIGVASMLPDGTLILQLRSEAKSGEIGEWYHEIKPNDARYAPYLKHIGGLKPGEEKPVPPWPDP
jgi:hypothetical protein